MTLTSVEVHQGPRLCSAIACGVVWCAATQSKAKPRASTRSFTAIRAGRAGLRRCLHSNTRCLTDAAVTSWKNLERNV